MAQVIIDVRQWQSMFDLRTGQKLEDDTPTIRMIQGLLDRHPYPGDIDIQSNRWVSDAALDLISLYEPRLVCLSYAQQYFSSRFSQLTQQEYKDQLGQVFTEVERFVEESGYTPVIVGTGDMTELEGEMDLSRLDGLAMSSAWSARYAGLIEHSERDLEYVKGLPHMERIVSRDEWTSLFEGIPHNPEDIPDYLLVADPGWTFRTATTYLRRAVRIPGVNSTIPVATDLGVVNDITGLRSLIEQNLDNTRIALIVIEGVGAQNFSRPYMPCSNGKGWFYYEPGESQYLTMTTGAHQVFTYSSGYFGYLNTEEYEEYPFSGLLTEEPQHTLGSDFSGRSIAVGNRSMFTHMVYGADICVECFARNLYNHGNMAVIHREK